VPGRRVRARRRAPAEHERGRLAQVLERSRWAGELRDAPTSNLELLLERHPQLDPPVGYGTGGHRLAVGFVWVPW